MRGRHVSFVSLVVAFKNLFNNIHSTMRKTMKSMTQTIVITGIIISLTAAVSMAAEKGSMTGHENMDHTSMNHTSSNHAEMDHRKMDHSQDGHKAEAMGVGVIHHVSKLNRMVNITHEPIPALKWPEMTMDLPVAKSVDLGSIKTGEKIKFHLELGEDKKFIITHIMK